MKYDGHRHDGILKPGEQFDPMGKATPELHELLDARDSASKLELAITALAKTMM